MRKSLTTPLGFSFKSRMISSVLGGLSIALTLFVGVFELCVGNAEELEFALVDVLGRVLLWVLLVLVLGVALLLPLKGKAFDVGVAVVAWLALMCFLQGNFLNIGVSSLAADGMGMKVHPVWEVGNGVLWLAVLVAVLWGVLRVKSDSGKEWLRMGLMFVFVLVIGVQTVGLVTTSLTSNAFSPKESPDTGRYILTEENLLEVSAKDNILIFVIDSFDADYVDEVLVEDPTYFDHLDGFTYYHDNLSWYTRTFPAAASMITGVPNDFSSSAGAYFDKAYGESSFLRDLKANDYKINLYIDDYYAYRDAKVMQGVVDNLSQVQAGYTIEDESLLVLHLVGVAAYRYMPIPLKRVFDLSTESFKGFVKYNGVEYPLYVSNDAVYFETLKESGLQVQSLQNQYMFIHMEGCHTPYRLDEDGKATSVGTAVSTTKGCMTIIAGYINELKRLGLYENATIVVTGDHPGRYNDYENLPHPTRTALFFKPKGVSGVPLAFSDSPVSQDLLLSSIVASAGLETSQPYEETYWDTAMTSRTYQFLKNTGATDYTVVTYEITGDSRDFANWRITKEDNIGFLYE